MEINIIMPPFLLNTGCVPYTMLYALCQDNSRLSSLDRKWRSTDLGTACSGPQSKLRKNMVRKGMEDIRKGGRENRRSTCGRAEELLPGESGGYGGPRHGDR